MLQIVVRHEDSLASARIDLPSLGCARVRDIPVSEKICGSANRFCMVFGRKVHRDGFLPIRNARLQ
jgi:hypothetical protein